MSSRDNEQQPVSAPYPEITAQLTEVVGAENLSSSPVDTIAHAVDFWPRKLMETRAGRWHRGPRWVVWPGAAAEVAHVLRIASTYAIPVIPYGGGSSMVGGASPRGERPWLVINCKRMCNILDMDEGSMVVHVQAGVVGVELEERLNARGFSLGHVPTSMTTATLGGWLSTRSSGMLSSRYGRISDLCLGITAVLPDGQLVHTRVAPRRATGPELMHLLLGAEGTLGIITAAHLRLHRLPLHRQFDSFRFERIDEAAEALRRSITSGVRPLVARIQRDPRLRRSDRDPDAPVPDAAALARRVLLLAFEGPAELVEAERGVVRSHVAELGGEALGQAPARRWWGQRFAAGFRMTPVLVRENSFADYVEAGVTWAGLAGLYRAMEEAFASRGWRTRLVVEHARMEGVSLGCAFWGDAASPQEAVASYDAAWKVAQQVCLAHGGRLGHVYGGGQHRAVLLDEWGKGRLELLTRIKRKLDPAGIMNPGVLGTEP